MFENKVLHTKNSMDSMVLCLFGQAQARLFYSAPQSTFKLVYLMHSHPKKFQRSIVFGSIHTVVIVWHLSVGFDLSGRDMAIITQQRESQTQAADFYGLVSSAAPPPPNTSPPLLQFE